MTYNHVFMSLLVCCTLLFLWAGFCNRKTARQRKDILDFIFQFKDWESRVSAYETVSYDTHFIALMKFSRAMDLYPPCVRPTAKD